MSMCAEICPFYKQCNEPKIPRICESYKFYYCKEYQKYKKEDEND